MHSHKFVSKKNSLLRFSQLVLAAFSITQYPLLSLAQSTDPAVSGQFPAQPGQPSVHSKWFGNDMTLSSPTSRSGASSSGGRANGSGVTLPGQTIQMQQFPIEDAPVGQKPTAAGGGTTSDAAPPTSLILTAKYFSDEPDVKAAYKEACAQKAAHFNEPAYYYRKAAILIQMGEYSKAGQELKGLLADIPNNSDYHLAQAYCFFKMGQKTAALDEVGMAKFHNPRLPANIAFE